jgi:hypothetical protein
MVEAAFGAGLVVAAIIANFVAQTRKQDLSSLVPRMLSRWIASANKE